MKVLMDIYACKNVEEKTKTIGMLKGCSFLNKMSSQHYVADETLSNKTSSQHHVADQTLSINCTF